jgi:ABC-2 type transport system ATP-binding protein
LKAQTDTDSLEGAFLALTGTSLRDESVSSNEQVREVAHMLGSSR